MGEPPSLVKQGDTLLAAGRKGRCALTEPRGEGSGFSICHAAVDAHGEGLDKSRRVEAAGDALIPLCAAIEGKELFPQGGRGGDDDGGNDHHCQEDAQEWQQSAQGCAEGQ